MKEFFKQTVQKIHCNASLHYAAKLSHAIKYLKSKLLLSCQICPVIDGRLTVECPMTGIPVNMFIFCYFPICFLFDITICICMKYFYSISAVPIKNIHTLPTIQISRVCIVGNSWQCANFTMRPNELSKINILRS